MIVILKQNPNRDQLESLISWLQEKGVTINEWDEASYNQLMETFTAYWQETAQEINDTAVEYLNLILACK